MNDITGYTTMIKFYFCPKEAVLRLPVSFSVDYRKNSKYWDMYVCANSIDSDQTALKEQSDQDLHCLPFFLHLLEAFLHCKIKLF